MALNLLGAVAATVVVGELGLGDTLAAFVVLSGSGALFLGGLLGATLSTRATTGEAS